VKTLACTIGCFDLLHPGHLDFLSTAAIEADDLIVGTPADMIFINLKGRPPIMTAEERCEILESLIMVSAAEVLPSLDYAAWVDRLRPSVLVMSVDHTADRFDRAAARVMSYGGRVVRLERSPRGSTSEIIERIASHARQDVLLCRDFHGDGA